MKLKYISYITLTSSLLFIGVSCKDSFLDTPPPGTYSDASLQNLKGVEGMLISTYAALDGTYFESWDNNYFNQVGGASNWVWGSIKGGDAYTGTEPSDGIDQKPVERHETQPSNGTLLNKWRGSYDGVAHANQTLRTLYGAVASGEIDATTAKRIEGEAKFLRGHFHFEVQKVFGVAAYVDETVTNDQLNSITNETPIWPQVEADLKFAYDNLPPTQSAAGRANKWAAGAYLAKVYIYQAKWADALALLNVVKGGTTTSGAPYGLELKYNDNFRTSAETGNKESIFAFEASAIDGTIANGNYENTLNQPHGSSAQYAGCCGFFQPSYSMVNSFKTDAVTGLPLIDTYNDSDIKSDEGLLSTDAYTADNTTPVDPRLDWTVGRRGIPYLDWGVHPGNNWIRQVANGGPFSPIKNVPYLNEKSKTAASVDWGFTSNATNVKIIRYADVLLWLAEAEAEVGSLANAVGYVNQVRTRAANVAGFVPASTANYKIGNYTSFASKAEALKAIRFERKLEFGMEGYRFFDLVRWHNATKAGKTALSFDIVAYLNGKDYLAKELGANHKRNHLIGATMTLKYRYEPLPEYVTTQTRKNVDQSTDWGGTRNPEN